MLGTLMCCQVDILPEPLENILATLSTLSLSDRDQHAPDRPCTTRLPPAEHRHDRRAFRSKSTHLEA